MEKVKYVYMYICMWSKTKKIRRVVLAAAVMPIILYLVCPVRPARLVDRGQVQVDCMWYILVE